MRKILTFPTWIIVKITIPFLPKSHPWYKRKFTLKDWAENSTPLNDAFSFNYWFILIMLIILIYIIN